MLFEYRLESTCADHPIGHHVDLPIHTAPYRHIGEAAVDARRKIAAGALVLPDCRGARIGVFATSTGKLCMAIGHDGREYEPLYATRMPHRTPQGAMGVALRNGRPPNPDGWTQMRIRVQAEERHTMELAAGAAHLPVHAWMVATLLGEADRVLRSAVEDKSDPTE